ncbi:hypothetical protein PMIN02_001909 [Paraphaeosphaeria minitans]
MVMQLNAIDIDSLSPLQDQTLQEFDDACNELEDLFHKKRSWNDLPDLRTLGNALDTLFFQGCIRGTCTYEWITHDRQGNPETTLYGYCTGYEKADCLNRISITALGHPTHPGPGTYKLPDVRANRLIGDIAGTILHEQLHQLLGYYVCDGNCSDATESQKQLCSYLYARTVELFSQVEDHGKRHAYSNHCGHGPAFQVLGRQVESNAFRMLGFHEAISLGYVSPCQCQQGQESSCLSH